ncbi:hypothetical protein KKB18_11910, partial [bacterium]|nr:hypothetical protein [bacterium]
YESTIGELGNLGLSLIKMDQGNIKEAIEGILDSSDKDNGLYLKILGKCYYSYIEKKIIEGSFESFDTHFLDKSLINRCIVRYNDFSQTNIDDELKFYHALFLISNDDKTGAFDLFKRMDTNSSFKNTVKIIQYQISTDKEKIELFKEILKIYEETIDQIKALAFIEIVKFYEKEKNTSKIENYKNDFGISRFSYPTTSLTLAKMYIKGGFPFNGLGELFQLVKNNQTLNNNSSEMVINLCNKLIGESNKEKILQFNLIRCKILASLHQASFNETDCIDDVIATKPDCFQCLRQKEKINAENGKDTSPLISEIKKILSYYEDLDKQNLTIETQKVNTVKDKKIFAFEIEIPAVYYACFENPINVDNFDIKLNLEDYKKGIMVGKDNPVWLFLKPEEFLSGLNIIEFEDNSGKLNSIEVLSSGIWDGKIFYDNIDNTPVEKGITSLSVISQHSSASIIVNGKDVSKNQLGYNIAAIDDKTGKVMESASFNTFVEESASTEMVNFLSKQKKGLIIAGAIRWDGSKFLSQEAVKTFQKMGLEESLIDKFTYCYGFITFKGSDAHALEGLDPEKVEILFLNR